MTFLKDYHQILLFGDSDSEVGEWRMVDVYKNLYKDTQKRLDAKNKANWSIEPKVSKLDRRDTFEGPPQTSNGWDNDAHKNLPGLRLIYERFPEAEWYIMFDDDTYVFIENLERELSARNLSSKDPHYLGFPMIYTGCDYEPFNATKPDFAQGGTGIIMSRGAVKQVLQGIDSCIMKLKDCWGNELYK
jgi:hypothetical protein